MRWLSNRAAAQPEAGPESYAVMPKALRLAAASLKGRAPVADKDVAKVLAAEVFPVSGAIIMGERTREIARRQAEEEAAKELRIGALVGDKGVFLGPWEPKDRNGVSVGKTYNVFAAPEDFTDSSGKKILLTYLDTVKELSKRRNWHGFDGGNFKNDTALYNALKDGSVVGKWFIPSKELVDGKNLNGDKVHGNNLYDNHENGAFAGTFTTKSSGSDYAHWYWSCTEHRDGPDDVLVVNFSEYDGFWFYEDNGRLSCRPCRVELAL